MKHPAFNDITVVKWTNPSAPTRIEVSIDLARVGKDIAYTEAIKLLTGHEPTGTIGNFFLPIPGNVSIPFNVPGNHPLYVALTPIRYDLSAKDIKQVILRRIEEVKHAFRVSAPAFAYETELTASTEVDKNEAHAIAVAPAYPKNPMNFEIITIDQKGFVRFGESSRMIPADGYASKLITGADCDLNLGIFYPDPAEILFQKNGVSKYVTFLDPLPFAATTDGILSRAVRTRARAVRAAFNETVDRESVEFDSAVDRAVHFLRKALPISVRYTGSCDELHVFLEEKFGPVFRYAFHEVIDDTIERLALKEGIDFYSDGAGGFTGDPSDGFAAIIKMFDNDFGMGFEFQVENGNFTWL